MKTIQEALHGPGRAVNDGLVTRNTTIARSVAGSAGFSPGKSVEELSCVCPARLSRILWPPLIKMDE
jgi:hypothetical protein